MKSYSPYDNVDAKDYPALLVTGGLNDPRVQYWEPAKWVAKLRCDEDRRPCLLVLKMEMGAGHSGPSGRYDAWRDEALRAGVHPRPARDPGMSRLVERTVITDERRPDTRGGARGPPEDRAAGRRWCCAIRTRSTAARCGRSSSARCSRRCPQLGVTCLRFNFRGVEGSEGAYGRRARRTARRAVPRSRRSRPTSPRSGVDVPLILTGWSFGGDVALTTVDDAISAWIGDRAAAADPARLLRGRGRRAPEAARARRARRVPRAGVSRSRRSARGSTPARRSCRARVTSSWVVPTGSWRSRPSYVDEVVSRS